MEDAYNPEEDAYVFYAVPNVEMRNIVEDMYDSDDIREEDFIELMDEAKVCNIRYFPGRSYGRFHDWGLFSCTICSNLEVLRWNAFFNYYNDDMPCYDITTESFVIAKLCLVHDPTMLKSGMDTFHMSITNNSRDINGVVINVGDFTELPNWEIILTKEPELTIIEPVKDIRKVTYKEVTLVEGKLVRSEEKEIYEN